MIDKLKHDKIVVKIVVTGGPCGGKSEALEYVKPRLLELGWTVLVVPETATELITGGVAPWTCKNNLDYHRIQMKIHDAMETGFDIAAEGMKLSKILIICDRGQPDCLAYLDKSEYERICDENGWYNLLYQYDGVFHLETTAKKFPQYYTLTTNEARHETVDEAIKLDARILEAYEDHPQRYIIEGENSFKKKLDNFYKCLTHFLFTCYST